MTLFEFLTAIFTVLDISWGVLWVTYFTEVYTFFPSLIQHGKLLKFFHVKAR